MTPQKLHPRVGRGVRYVAPRHDDPTTWLSRGEAAKLLGITTVSVLRLDKSGALHPIRDFRNDARYDPDEINAYSVAHPRRGRGILSDGDLTAEAVKLLEQGRNRRELVVELRITFARADELYREWAHGDFETALAAHARAETRRAQQREQAERERARAQRRAQLRQTLREIQQLK